MKKQQSKRSHSRQIYTNRIFDSSKKHSRKNDICFTHKILRNMESNEKNQISVNQVKVLNKTQVKIIVTGINELTYQDISEIIEKTFSIIKKGECDKCLVAAPIDKRCICYF